MRAWRVGRYGAPADVLTLEEVEAPEPGRHEVRIRTSSITLNFNDIDGIYGRYRTVPIPPPYTPGMEVLGQVEACGPGAEAWMGRRVVAVPTGAYGGYAEAVVAPTAMVFDMPADIGEPEAAAILMPFHLAWLGVYSRAQLRPDETLLVHAAAGGAGSAAVQLGAAVGARVIATAGSAGKRSLCRALGAEVALDYATADFVDDVLEATAGRGVDVAFDTVGGPVTTATFRCMAFNGRHVIAGFASGIEAEDEGIVPRPILFGNFSLSGVCLGYVADPSALKRATGFNFPSRADGEQAHRQILEMIRQRQLRPLVGLELPFLSLPEGVQALERRQTMGRVVVRLD